MTPKKFAIIVGSGFAGSLLGWILARHGRDTVIVDRGKHPRFAIGESSTPTADFLISYLSERWDLAALKPLAAFGTWQTQVPELRCGLKRGFSYFGHRTGQPYYDTSDHHHSLLVAASASDAWSDTHWYRADVDAWMARQATSAGAELHEQSSIEQATWNPDKQSWSVMLQSSEGPSHRFEAQWLIDASGSGHATAAWCKHSEDSHWMRTRSSAIYGHFDHVGSFSSLYASQFGHGAEIFDSDDAAQHHIESRGWFWMLRFLGDRTSVGFVEARPQQGTSGSRVAIEDAWKDWLLACPTVAQLLEPAMLVDPKNALGEPQLQRVSRMSRCRSQACGRGWIALPVAYGFVDPLHSFGIAHSLSGIARVAEGLLGAESQQQRLLRSYSEELRREIDWFDTLISGSYRGLPSDRRFMAFAAIYFAAAVEFERQMARDPAHWPYGYMNSALTELRTTTDRCWGLVGDHVGVSDERFIEAVRTAIQPWNDVGLLDPKNKQRLDHTAPPKRLAMRLPKSTSAR